MHSLLRIMMALYIAISLALGQIAEQEAKQEADDKFPVTPQAFMQFTQTSFTDINKQLRQYMEAFDSFQAAEKRRMQIATMDEPVGIEVGVDAEQQVVDIGEGPIIKLILEQLDVVTDEIEAMRRRLPMTTTQKVLQAVGQQPRVPKADDVAADTIWVHPVEWIDPNCGKKFLGWKETGLKTEAFRLYGKKDAKIVDVLAYFAAASGKGEYAKYRNFYTTDARGEHGSYSTAVLREATITGGTHYYVTKTPRKACTGFHF